MNKTPEKVTKNKGPKHDEAARKGKEKCMNKLKERILNDVKKDGNTTNASNETTSATNNASNETTCVTNSTTARSNDTYVHGVGIVAVLAIGVCVFFCICLTAQHEQKKINHQNDVQCFRKIIIMN